MKEPNVLKCLEFKTGYPSKSGRLSVTVLIQRISLLKPHVISVAEPLTHWKRAFLNFSLQIKITVNQDVRLSEQGAHVSVTAVFAPLSTPCLESLLSSRAAQPGPALYLHRAAGHI